MKKRKTYKSVSVKEINVFDVNIIIISTVMLCGIITGVIAAVYISSDVRTNICDYIIKFISSLSVDESNHAALLNSIVNLFKYPITVFLLGLTAFGIVFIPVVVFLRGFSISFVVSAVIQTLSHKGIVLAFVTYGLQAIATITCTLMIASKGMVASKRMLNLIRNKKRDERAVENVYLVLFAICICVLFLISLLEVYIIPRVIMLTASLMNF